MLSSLVLHIVIKTDPAWRIVSMRMRQGEADTPPILTEAGPWRCRAAGASSCRKFVVSTADGGS